LAATKTIRVALDSLAGVTILANAAAEAGSTIGILIDLDVGFHRTGVQSSAEALAIAQAVAGSKSLRLDGLFFFPGHLRESVAEQIPKLRQVDAIVLDAVDALKESGLHVSIVSGGSTPSLYQLHHLKTITEIRPGTYVFNDMSTVAGGYCAIDDCAARVTATVVSTAVPGKCVVDAGTKTLAADRNSVRPESGFGYVVEYPDAKIIRLTEEHGEIDISTCDRSPKTGDRLTLIPNHICPCVNLQAAAWTRHLDGSLQPLHIDARGLIS
jgi:D-serine deaminase-like pyridoxal phosphate-dependent protein